MHVALRVGHREHDDLRVRQARRELLEHLDAVHARQVDVEQHDVRPHRERQREGVLGRGGLATSSTSGASMAWRTAERTRAWSSTSMTRRPRGVLHSVAARRAVPTSPTRARTEVDALGCSCRARVAHPSALTSSSAGRAPEVGRRSAARLGHEVSGSSSWVASVSASSSRTMVVRSLVSDTPVDAGRHQRRADLDRAAARELRADEQAAADEPCALVHAPQAEALVEGLVVGRSRVRCR